jgi:hypothetical protein
MCALAVVVVVQALLPHRQWYNLLALATCAVVLLIYAVLLITRVAK